MILCSHSASATISPRWEPSKRTEGACDEAMRLHAAVQWGRHADAAALIAEGAALDHPDAAGETPLHLALRLGDAAMAALLLMAGADASLETSEGVAPRTIAHLAGGRFLLRLVEGALLQQTVSEIYGLAL